MKQIACVVLLLLAATAAALAQVSESTTVEVIQVPVYVTGHGAPVANLTRDNFRLFVNGKQQSIDYFDVIDFATLPADAVRDPRQRRLYLLVFDLTFSSANALQRAQKAAEQMIESGREGDTFGIATMLPAGGANVIVPFSRDRVALVRAIRNLRPSRMPDPLRLALTPGEREGIAGGGVFRGGADGVLITAQENAMGESESQYLRDAIENAIGDLADLAVRLAPLEGVKHVVLLSTGFDAALIHGVSRSRGPFDARPSRDRERQANLGFNPRLLGAMQRMHQTFASSSVFLDAIDIAGLRPMQRFSDNEALYTLTRDTGGEVVDRRNDLSGAMQYLVNLQRVAYVLSFNAHNTGRLRNKLVVKLVNAPSGSHAAYRESYASEVDPADSGDPLRLADIVMNDIPQTGVTTTAHIDPGPGRATINVDVAAGEVLAQSAGMTLQGEVLLYIFSGPGAVAFNRKQITVEPRAMAALATQPVRVSQTFDLPPGQYVAKALIRFGINGTLGFARSEFTVPPASP
jgi:VWFA-related protein